MIRLVTFLLGAWLVMITGGLSYTRQAQPQSASVAYVDWDSYIYRHWRDDPTQARRITQRVPSIEDYYSVSWSPNGRWITFVDYSIYRIAAWGGPVERLTETFDGGISWAPDSQSLAYYSAGAGNMDIYRLDAPFVGQPPQRLTTHPADDFTPKWSPDGNWIAFNSYRGTHPGIYVLHLRDGSITPLTENTAVQENLVGWSADSQWVEGRFYVGDETNQIMRVSLDGTQYQTLARVPAQGGRTIQKVPAPPISWPWQPLRAALVGLILLGGSGFALHRYASR